jgi:asparagine synthase (glutamine-hydrolysing)
MCGIAGVLLHRDEIPEEAQLLSMGDAMISRGPDDAGILAARHIGLVHRRLSIRDLSPTGHCPMGSADGRIQIVFNGEIYNWRELRQGLEAGGCSFVSQSDTEVILHGYRAWGEAVIPRLRGMFAVAIWDGGEKRLLLARDRAGEKPLYYQVIEGGLAFASAIEALKPMVPERQIDPVALAAHLVHSFIPASHAIWKGVQVLPPAHTLSIPVGGAPVLRRYWDFPRAAPRQASVRQCAKAVESVLDDSVSRCLDADVPVGVFLSGGVDSSLVTAFAARHQKGIHAFSLGFAEERYSELPYAHAVAEHLGLPHHTLTIDVEDVLGCLPHLVVQYGQPFGDASAVPSYLLSRFARKRVKVCLSGDGGDESFGGYWRVQSGIYAARFGAILPRSIREHWVPSLAARFGNFGKRLGAMNQLSLATPGQGYTNALTWFGKLSSLAGPKLLPALECDLAALRVGRALGRPEASVMQALLYDDFQVQLPDAYLVKMDVASMAASLEVRAPFLDQEMIELAWTLPDSVKLNWGRRKWLLKQIASQWVPPEVIYRPKMGFAMPLDVWFRGRLGNVLEGLLDNSVAAQEGWLQSAPVRQFLRAHRMGENHTARLWLVLWLELWFRLVVNGASPESTQLNG